jgi:lipoprotein-anchoring transpeptidase ErfK/SrfK
MSKLRSIFSCVLAAFCCINCLAQAQDASKQSTTKPGNHIVISKQDARLYVIADAKGDTLLNVPVSVGKNPGDKQKVGDCRTPEGTFSIIQVQDASTWTHDFKDGKGVRKGAYGPLFFRLKTPPHRGIGIHGTCFPEQIGTRCSEGCIRLLNDDVLKLSHLVGVGTKVIIEKDL